MSKTNHVNVKLSLREAGIVCLMRRIGFGTIDKISIHDSQPAVVIAGAQRIDLCKSSELSRVLNDELLESKDGLPGMKTQAIDLAPAGVPATIKDMVQAEEEQA